MNVRIILAALFTATSTAFAATPAIVDANGATLGIPLRTATDPTQVTVVSPKGFIVNFDSSTGDLAANVQDPVGNRIFSNQPYFESADCTGQGYLPIGPSASAVAGGVVMGADPSLWGTARVYIPKNPASPVRTLRSSRYAGSTCVDRSAFPLVGAAVVPLPNVTATTGVSGAAALPMRLEIVSDCVFANGFQCPSL